jgi:hypothetical protein
MSQAQGYYTIQQGQGILENDSSFRVFKEVAPNVWPETPHLDVGVRKTLVQGNQYLLEAKMPMQWPSYTKGAKLKVEFKLKIKTGPNSAETVYAGTKIMTAEVNAP